MKVKAKISFAGNAFSAIKGQVIDLPDKIAQDLIRADYAEAVKDEDKRSNAGDDTKPVKGKRSSAKRG